MSKSVEQMDTNRVVSMWGYITVASVFLVGALLESRMAWEIVLIGAAILCLSFSSAAIGDGYNRRLWQRVFGDGR